MEIILIFILVILGYVYIAKKYVALSTMGLIGFTIYKAFKYVNNLITWIKDLILWHDTIKPMVEIDVKKEK